MCITYDKSFYQNTREGYSDLLSKLISKGVTVILPGPVAFTLYPHVLSLLEFFIFCRDWLLVIFVTSIPSSAQVYSTET